LDVLDLTLSGGEPMMHKNICDFIRSAKKHDFSVSILSNLTFLNDEIIAELKNNQLASIQTSLYSMDHLIHDSITKLEGSFHKTYNNILKLIENDIPLQISCPTMKQNKDSYTDVMKWAHEHKCRATTDYLLMARYDRTKDNLVNRLSLSEIETVINTILDNDENYQDDILSEDLDSFNKKDRSNDIVCGVCISTICMAANGNIYPCPGWQDYTIGNLKDTSLKEIWEKSSRIKYLRSLRIKNFPKCNTCSDINFCALCMVRNANENPNGDLFEVSDHFCKVAALNKKIVMNWRNKRLSRENKIDV
jgi:radical SAM protein with 4Fe4S-binding SPASM domain